MGNFKGHYVIFNKNFANNFEHHKAYRAIENLATKKYLIDMVSVIDFDMLKDSMEIIDDMYEEEIESLDDILKNCNTWEDVIASF